MRVEELVPKGGLEPPRVAPYAPQTYVSTNSTTSACWENSNHEEVELEAQGFLASVFFVSLD